jgi:hypothetical protein
LCSSPGTPTLHTSGKASPARPSVHPNMSPSHS